MSHEVVFGNGVNDNVRVMSIIMYLYFEHLLIGVIL